MYNSEDLGSTVKQFNDGYRKLYEEGLPPALGIHQAVMNSPQGKAFGLFFLWNSSDLEAGDVWLKKICSLAPLAMQTVAKTTVADWLNLAASMVGGSTVGTMVSVGFKSVTPEIADVLATYGEKMPPSPSTMFGIHELRDGPSTSLESRSDSVFAAREPHYMLEIFPTAAAASSDADADADADAGAGAPSLDESLQWATEFRETLMQTDPQNILSMRYLPFAPPQGLDLREIFQDRYELLAELKREYDPRNVFRLALARF